MRQFFPTQILEADIQKGAMVAQRSKNETAAHSIIIRHFTTQPIKFNSRNSFFVCFFEQPWIILDFWISQRILKFWKGHISWREESDCGTIEKESCDVYKK